MVIIDGNWAPERETTFWTDFSIADRFGTSSVRETFQRAFDEWKSNYKYLTELVIVLNWKIREHHNNWNNTLAKVYKDIWQIADNYAVENLKDEELKYFIRITD